MQTLILNAGSSSLKFALLDGEAELGRGLIERIGLEDAQGPHAQVKDRAGHVLCDRSLPGLDHAGVLDWLLDWVPEAFGGVRPGAVGHRVVHGGDRFTQPVRVSAEVLAALEELVPLAPLHEPHNLGPMRHLARTQPRLPQVACFDTAFHAGQDPLRRRFALPRDWYDRGVKRYGFHGLSYEYVACRLREIDRRLAAGRVVVCHLGNGSSLCALRDGRSVATTMSFTPLDGLVMGTRCGALDPGVLLHLLRHEGLTADRLDDLLNRESGLLGVSGFSSDMRDLLASDRPEAAEAVEIYCRRIAEEIGRSAAILEGLDGLVFTAGIGEHAAPIRARVGQLCRWLGLEMEEEANRAGGPWLHRPTSRVAALVVPTDEERMIARHTRAVLGNFNRPSA